MYLWLKRYIKALITCMTRMEYENSESKNAINQWYMRVLVAYMTRMVHENPYSKLAI